MQRSVPAVKSLLVRARENLRQALAAYMGLAPEPDPGTPGPGVEVEPLSPKDRLRRDRQLARASKHRPDHRPNHGPNHGEDER